MKNIIYLILIFAFNLPTYSQEFNDETFKKEVNKMLKEAESGFKTTKGDFNYYDDFRCKTYHATMGIYDQFQKANVTYCSEKYLQYANETLPAEFYFSQYFDKDNPATAYIYDNSERIFDDLTNTMHLKKKIAKKDKKATENQKCVKYSKNGQVIFELIYYTEKQTFNFSVYSDLKPNDAPKYQGCMVLYYMQSGRAIGASCYFVWGDTAIRQDALYDNIMRNMRSDGKESYSNYEWLPSATEQVINQRMKDLNFQFKNQMFDVNTDGFSITP